MNSNDELKPSATAAFDAHYRAGWAILKRAMLMGTNQRPNESGKDAEQAIAHFRECLLLEPTSWTCMWALGKAEQAMGDHRKAMTWLDSRRF